MSEARERLAEDVAAIDRALEDLYARDSENDTFAFYDARTKLKRLAALVESLAQELAETRTALEKGDKAASDLHDAIYALVTNEADRKTLSDMLWEIHHRLRPALAGVPARPAPTPAAAKDSAVNAEHLQRLPEQEGRK